MRMRGALAIVAVSFSWSVASTAVADPTDGAATADRLFEEGRLFAKAGRFKEACQRFSQSDVLKRTFGTAVNLGDCAERDGHLALAWQLFDDAARTAERTGSRELAKFARDRAAALAPRLCTVVVRVADPTLAGLTMMVGDRTLQPAAEVGTLVEPGEVSVTIDAANTPPLHQSLPCAAGAITFVHFPALTPAIEPVGAAAAPSVVAVAPVEPDHRATDAPSSFHYQALAVGAGVLGAAALVAGIGFGVSAKNAQDAAHQACPSEQQGCADAGRANELIRTGHSRAITADVAFGISAAAAIGAGMLWVVGRRRDAHGVAIAPVATPNQIALTAGGSF